MSSEEPFRHYMLGESTDDYLGRREREREQQRAADLVTGPAVYLIGPRPPHLGFVKIGITKHLAERLKQLEAASTVPLHVMAGVDGDEALERWLHAHFDERRRHGEWFDFEGVDAVALVTTAVEQALSGGLNGGLF
ncbi:GIY-YIG nuclease family protein [Streptomyces zaomyceticus]|uniref:GIY-YIG nuclease family protein n=1 Tax=Streptomyces zaomyceticus TaxID=68286 RepID=UPI0036567589